MKKNKQIVFNLLVAWSLCFQKISCPSLDTCSYQTLWGKRQRSKCGIVLISPLIKSYLNWNSSQRVDDSIYFQVMSFKVNVKLLVLWSSRCIYVSKTFLVRLNLSKTLFYYVCGYELKCYFFVGM